MKKLFNIIFLVATNFLAFAQVDSIQIQCKLNDEKHELNVQQKIVFYNNYDFEISTFGLNAWINAYSGRETKLNTRKLENRNKNLYFANENEKGAIENLIIKVDNQELKFNFSEREFVTIDLQKPILPKQSQTIFVNYTLKIPKDFITKFGFGNEEYLLKYFFLQPTNYENAIPKFTHFIDEENLLGRQTNYQISFYNTLNYNVESNLIKTNTLFKDTSFQIPVFHLKKKDFISYKNNNTEVVISNNFPDNQKQYVDELLSKQLQFLQEYVGEIPQKILITPKTEKLQNFTGIEDLKLNDKLKFSLFSQKQQADLQLFQWLSYEALQQLLITDKNTEHWLNNGLLTYLQIKYIEKYYKDSKLLGEIPNKLGFWKIKPLNWFFVSKLPLSARFKLGYLYIVRQNYDQPISTEFTEFNNINQTLISQFKTGITFHFISEYVGEREFNSLITNFIKKYQYQQISAEEFQAYFTNNSPKDISWFFAQLLNNKKRINFKLKNFENVDNQLKINVKETNTISVPFQIVAYDNKDSIVTKKWFTTTDDVQFPNGNYKKLIINPDYIFPEFNDRDNYLNTKGIFKNRKKIQFKLYSDIENPEYDQIFFAPKFKWNDYDKLMIGMKFYNSTPLIRNFKYSITPSYSSGTNSLTGSSNFNYRIFPQQGIIRNITLFSGFSYYHYDKELEYKKITTSAVIDFAKRPRSEISKGFRLGYNYVDKEPNPNQTEEDFEFNKYHLLEFGLYYADTKLIHEKSAAITLQHSNLFQKVFAEGFYRYEYARDKKISTRIFAGIFLRNDTENSTYFDFGISKVSDYAFSFNLLGRSAKSGVFYQEYVQAEGGMKTFFEDNYVNQWLVSNNTEMHIWKWFDFYGSTMLYKNQSQNAQILYETGIRLRIIPDFIEFYFPIQTTNGFEPTRDNYLKNIRFTFRLDVAKVINTIRRGWY